MIMVEIILIWTVSSFFLGTSPYMGLLLRRGSLEEEWSGGYSVEDSFWQWITCQGVGSLTFPPSL